MTLPPRIRTGDRVYVQGMPVMAPEVIDTSDPAYVVLPRSSNGATLKTGRFTVIPVVSATVKGSEQ